MLGWLIAGLFVAAALDDDEVEVDQKLKDKFYYSLKNSFRHEKCENEITETVSDLLVTTAARLENLDRKIGSSAGPELSQLESLKKTIERDTEEKLQQLAPAFSQLAEDFEHKIQGLIEEAFENTKLL